MTEIMHSRKAVTSIGHAANFRWFGMILASQFSAASLTTGFVLGTDGRAPSDCPTRWSSL